jgi:two-component system LytT family response regulator
MSSILIVEDDKKVGELLRRYIHELDGSATCALFPRAADAYEYASAAAVDLFILDIQLLDYNGASLAKQLRALPQYRFTPILFATALAGEELTMYRDVRCHDFLVKPFTRPEFERAFASALDMSNRLRQPPEKLRIEQKQFVFEYEIPNIIYVESFGKRIVIHSRKDESSLMQDTISGYSLARILEMLRDDDFVQCHKSYLVNRSHIAKIDKREMTISLKRGDVKIPVGDKFRENVWGRNGP